MEPHVATPQEEPQQQEEGPQQQESGNGVNEATVAVVVDMPGVEETAAAETVTPSSDAQPTRSPAKTLGGGAFFNRSVVERSLVQNGTMLLLQKQSIRTAEDLQRLASELTPAAAEKVISVSVLLPETLAKLPEVVALVSMCSNLQLLNINGPTIIAASELPTVLAGVASLTRVDIDNSDSRSEAQIDSAVLVRFLNAIPNLQQLEATELRVADAQGPDSPVLTCHALTRINIRSLYGSRQPCSAGFVKQLVSSPALESISLVGVLVTSDAIQSFAEARLSPRLQQLNLSRNRLGAKKSVWIADSLKHLGHLTHLNLASNDIDDAALGPLCDAFRQLCNVQEIDLSSNSIRHDGFAKLAEVIPMLPQLEQLSVEGQTANMNVGQRIKTNMDVRVWLTAAKLLPFRCVKLGNLDGFAREDDLRHVVKHYNDGQSVRIDLRAMPRLDSASVIMPVTLVTPPSTFQQARLMFSGLPSIADLGLDISVIITVYIAQQSYGLATLGIAILVVSTLFSCYECWADGRSDLIPWQILSLSVFRESFRTAFQTTLPLNILEPVSKPCSCGPVAVSTLVSREASFEALPQLMLQMYASMQSSVSAVLVISLLSSLLSVANSVTVADMHAMATAEETMAGVPCCCSDGRSLPGRISRRLSIFIWRFLESLYNSLLWVLLTVAYQYWVLLPFCLALLVIGPLVRSASRQSGFGGAVFSVMQTMKLLVVGPGFHSFRPYWAYEWEWVVTVTALFRTIMFAICVGVLWGVEPLVPVGALFIPSLILVCAVGGFCIVLQCSLIKEELDRLFDT